MTTAIAAPTQFTPLRKPRTSRTPKTITSQHPPKVSPLQHPAALPQTPAQPLPSPSTLNLANQSLLNLLPAIRGYASRQLSWMPQQEREEACSEAAALALVSCHSLIQRNRARLITTPGFMRFAFQAVRHGRSIGSSQAAEDVMSPLGRRRHGRTVTSLHRPVRDPRPATGSSSPMYLQDVMVDRRTPVPDRAAFRIDYAEWLQQWNPKQRRMMALLAAGEKPVHVARRLKLSPTRITQCRRRWQQSWEAYIADRALA